MAQLTRMDQQNAFNIDSGSTLSLGGSGSGFNVKMFASGGTLNINNVAYNQLTIALNGTGALGDYTCWRINRYGNSRIR